MLRAFGFLGAIWILLGHGLGWAGEAMGVLVEIRMGKGEVRIKRAGEEAWTMPQPLLELRPGDQFLATGDSRAVLLFMGGRTDTVSSANSPFIVRDPTTAEPAQGMVAAIAQFLLGKGRDRTYLPLSTRAPLVQPPLILSPRETKLLPGPVVFEWGGSDRLRYHVRILDPRGLLWEQANLRREPLAYPATAPALSAGVPYTWELEAQGHPVQRGRFEMLANSEAVRVRAALALLEPAVLPGYPRATTILIRAGLLFQEGLYHDARRELLAGIAADPEEATLHRLLGHIYDRVGLRDQAGNEFEEAQILTTRKP